MYNIYLLRSMMVVNYWWFKTTIKHHLLPPSIESTGDTGTTFELHAFFEFCKTEKAFSIGLALLLSPPFYQKL